MFISTIKGYNIILKGDMYNLPDETYKNKYKAEPSTLKLLAKLHTTR